MKKLFTLFTAILFSIAVNAQTVVDIIVNSPDHTTLEAAVIAPSSGIKITFGSSPCDE
jgi:hypothetical protein